MRDADRIREVSPPSPSRTTVIFTLAALVGVAGVFAMGYTIGRRVQRLAPADSSPPCDNAPPSATRSFEQQEPERLAFYDALMSESERVDVPMKASARATASPAAKSAPPAAATSDPEGKAGMYTLQVSSVRKREEARALATAMTRRGLRPYIAPASLSGRGTWYRVRVGHYASQQQANAARAHLAKADILAKVMRTD